MPSGADLRVPEGKAGRFRAVLCGQGVLLALLLPLAAMDPASFADYEALIYPCCVLLLAMLIWSVVSWKLVGGSLFDPYVLFLTAAAVFNGGQALLEVFHLNEGGILNGVFSSQTLFNTLYLVLISLAALHLGALISAGMARGSDGNGGSPPHAEADTRTVGWALVMVSIVPTGIYLASCLGPVMAYGYAGFYLSAFTTGSESIWRVLAIFLAPGALFLLAGSRGMTLNKITAGVLLVVYSVANLFMGHRSWGAYPLLAFAWLWHRTIRPLSPRTAVILVLVMMTVLPLVANVRSISGEERTSLASIREAFLSVGNPFVALVAEMGGSMAAVSHTIELVPSERGFDHGTGYARAALTLVPSLYWGLAETYGDWLMWTVLPSAAKAGIGSALGFSFIAEAYANFGWVGTPVFTFVLGLLLARLVMWAESSEDVARKALMACFLVFFIAYARGESAGEVGRLFWAAFAPYLAVVGLQRLRLRARDGLRMHS